MLPRMKVDKSSATEHQAGWQDWLADAYSSVAGKDRTYQAKMVGSSE